MPDRAGIYRITNVVNGKSYVGSSVNLAKRLVEHKRLLARGDHTNVILQNAHNKYGASAFKYEIVATCPKKKSIILRLERAAMSVLGPRYNISKVPYSVLGTRRTPEALAKMRANWWRGGNGGATRGYRHTEGAKIKIGLATKNRARWYYAAHVRWHVQRNLTSNACAHCPRGG